MEYRMHHGIASLGSKWSMLFYFETTQGTVFNLTSPMSTLEFLSETEDMDYTGCKHLPLTQRAAAVELLNLQDSKLPMNALFSHGTSLMKQVQG